ncbi:MAG: phosphoenolpyruvate carboxylase, partial [Sphingopyxis sp.]
HKNRVADLMKMKDAGLDHTPSGDRIDEALHRQIALLWQTRPLRRDRLFVADEVENARAYMQDVFLPALPMLYARWERVLGHRPPAFLRLGSWIGGDRDGNPFVTADALRHALGRQCETALVHYLDGVHALGQDLSIATGLSNTPDAVLALAEASGDTSPSRADEPYRRALAGIYARLCATHIRLTGKQPPRPSMLSGEAYASPSELRHDLAVLANGLASDGAGILASGGALGRLIR